MLAVPCHLLKLSVSQVVPYQLTQSGYTTGFNDVEDEDEMSSDEEEVQSRIANCWQ